VTAVVANVDSKRSNLNGCISIQKHNNNKANKKLRKSKKDGHYNNQKRTNNDLQNIT
jgi:hypothetical protein